jgi:hypothetical protein
MLKSGGFPNLYAQTLFFQIQDNVLPLLMVVLMDPAIAAHILFGSDYNMIGQEIITKQDLSIRLCSVLSEDLYWQIAAMGPKRYLGEKKTPTLFQR